MDNVYIYIVIDHQSFTTGKICIVELPSTYTFIDTYKQLAKEKACDKLGLTPNEVIVQDFKFLGSEVEFIK